MMTCKNLDLQGRTQNVFCGTMFQKCGVLLSLIWCPSFFQVQNQHSEITVNCVLTMTMEGKFRSIMKSFCYIICPDTVIFLKKLLVHISPSVTNRRKSHRNKQIKIFPIWGKKTFPEITVQSALCSLGLHIQELNQEWIKSIWNF